MTDENLPLQTRSEKDGLNYFATLSEALKFAEQNKSVWKISFSFEGERVRLVRRDDGFVVELLDIEGVVNHFISAINHRLDHLPQTEEQLRTCRLCRNWELGAGTIAPFCNRGLTVPTTHCFVGGPKKYI